MKRNEGFEFWLEIIVKNILFHVPMRMYIDQKTPLF
jgi:hypothetical protein